VLLKEFRVREFRSIWDSGPVGVGEITCLVGKNEAGKTALLKALYRLNPVIDEDARFDVTDDYPRREVSDYQDDVLAKRKPHTTPISAVFTLTGDDVQPVSDLFGPDALLLNEVELFKSYDNSRTFSLQFDEKAAQAHLLASAELVDQTRDQLRSTTDWKSLADTLAAVEATAAVTHLRELVAKILKAGNGSTYAYNTFLARRLPKFLYFDEYYQLRGHENIPALIERKKTGKLAPSDRPLLGLINIARLKLEDLSNIKRTVELSNTLEGASNQLTKRILPYWSQNKHLHLRFDVREARPEDPPDMRTGSNIWGRVYDTAHLVTTELGSRSRGFVWFFSFVAWYEDIKRGDEDLVLLLDEPGLSLHAKAQADLLRYFEEQLRPHNQVVYTTHSPFMIDPRHFERVLVVQDASIDADVPQDHDGTRVLTNVLDASDDSLFPLQGALGYEIHQTLFVGPNTLIVEGPADLLFLQAMSSVVQQRGKEGLSDKWTITPVGGAGKVPTFVALLSSQTGLKIATLLDIQASEKHLIEDLYKKRLLAKKHVLTYANFTGGKEADVEDMFERDFYLRLVNSEFSRDLSTPIALSDLNMKMPRILKALEAHFAGSPMKAGVSFGHFRPARFLTENLGVLEPQISQSTVERFSKAFYALNTLL
jgi:AAA15 family ATPase/GTPase